MHTSKAPGNEGSIHESSRWAHMAYGEAGDGSGHGDGVQDDGYANGDGDSK